VVRRALRRTAAALPAVALVLALTPPVPAAAGGPTTWSGGLAPASPSDHLVDATTVLDGTSGLAQFHYKFDACTGPLTPSGCGGPGIALRTLYFATTADDPGKVTLTYRFSGFHAYAGVTVGLHANVVSVLHSDVDLPIVDDGPVSCCTPPSAGFTYSGSIVLDVEHGDTYGFTITGSNGDSTSILEGTLSVAVNVVDNGSFEFGAPDDGTGGAPAGVTRLAPGAEILNGWTIEHDADNPLNSAEVDWTGSRWSAKEGNRSLELAGGPSAGAIHQDLPTIAGNDYTVSFYYSANPERLFGSPPAECGAGGTPQFNAMWAGSVLTPSPIQYTASNTAGAMNYQNATFVVTAPAATTQLRFASANSVNTGCGIVIDNVTVTPVIPAPPPAETPQADDGTYVVTSTADHNDAVCGVVDCTLREAIYMSNAFAAPSGHSITFAIPGAGSHVINLVSSLPPLEKPLLIDGTTQAGTTCGPNLTSNLMVHVNASGAGSEAEGFDFDGFSGGSTIKGLVLEGFASYAINFGNSSDNVVECSAIGTAAHPNQSVGIEINASSGNRIGSDNDGTNDQAEANEISHNAAGPDHPGAIEVANGSDGNRLDGNSIHDNGGLGIDLLPAGPTPNDPTDADTGPNGLLNTPQVVRAEAGANGGIAGRLVPAPGPAGQDVTLFVSPACDPSGFGEGATRIGTAHVTPDTNGIANFVVSIGGLPVGQFVTATATDSSTGATSEFSSCVRIGPGNDSWPNALDISSLATSQDSIEYSGQTRWYKFSITPGTQVTVNLGTLPADYDLLLFKDIQQAYAALNSGDPTLIAAQFSGTGQKFSATGQKFSGTGQKFSDDVFSGTGQKFSGTGQKFSGDLGFSGDAFSGTGQKFSATDFSGTGQKFSDQGFAGTGQKFSPDAYSGAQAVSLIDFSATTGVAPEAITANTWNNTGFFYIRVSGRGGVFDPSALFTVSESQTGSNCAGLSTYSADPLPAPVGTGIKTVILTDPSRLAGSAADKTTLDGQLTTLQGRTEVSGAVVNVGANLRIQHLNAQADAHKACPYAKNLVADALKAIVDSYRTASNPNLAYVLLVGGDNVLPFFRYADTSGFGPESSYLPPVGPTTASESSLRLNYVLGQDAYGAKTQLPEGVGTFPVADLAVGRLVETAGEASTVLNAYLTGTTGGTVPTPTRTLTTGYDFMTDAANSVQSDFAAGIGSGAGTVKDTLIAPNNILPTDPQSWNATQLRTKLLGSGRHDLVFLAGHFSANSALAADFSTTVQASEIAATATDFKNTIVFSQGCHSGYGIVDDDAIPNVTDPLDWAQAFARKGATMIGGTGYQYGDTDLVQYSEAIYADFAHELRLGTGPVSVGQALLNAKKAYLRATPTLDGVDTKALLESTVFGLPMISVNLPAGRIPVSGGGAAIVPVGVGSGPGASLGLATKDLPIDTATGVSPNTKVLTGIDGAPNTTATWYTGPDGVVTAPSEPVLPLVSRDVTAAATTLRGVGFRTGTYTDLTPRWPLVTDPATEVRTAHTAFLSPIFYPIQIATANYFDALGGGQTRLLVTPVQHKADPAPATSNTLRKFSDINVRLFYSNNTSAAALSAPPSILDVSGSGTGPVDFSVHVAGDPAAGIQGVWITYTGFDGTWASKDLTVDPTDPSHWTGSISVPSGHTAGQLRFVAQAVNGTGLVTLDSNFGSFYQVTSGAAAAPAATTMTLAAAPASGVFGSQATFNATLAGASPLSGQPVELTVAGATKVALTNASGQASASFTLNAPAGTYPVSASYAGDSANSPSAASRNFTISKQNTSLTLSGPSNGTVGQPTGVIATLKDSNSNGLGQRSIFFVISNASNAQSKSVITDYLGRAPLGSLSLPPGNYTVAAYFEGTFTLLPSATQLTLTDDAFGASSASAPYGNYWPFAGFYQPVDNVPTINIANAGQAIPIKFSLGGNLGLNILQAGYPKFTTETCPNAATDAIETTVAATGNSLTYDAASGQYTFVWKSDKSLAGKCIRFDLGLIDGSTRQAEFKLK
jgi:CSLREA domain-containing protein